MTEEEYLSGSLHYSTTIPLSLSGIPGVATVQAPLGFLMLTLFTALFLVFVLYSRTLSLFKERRHSGGGGPDSTRRPKRGSDMIRSLPNGIRFLAIGLIIAGGVALAPQAFGDSLTTPILIATASNQAPTLGIPRWKGYVSELNPQNIWVSFGSGGSRSRSMTYSTNAGTSWSSNTIQIDNRGSLDMHLSCFGLGENLYFSFPGSLGQGICFRKFNSPSHSDLDQEAIDIMPGTDSRHHSNVMVQDNGRIWVFTRRRDSPSENVRYHYSDNGANWTSGTAYATGARDVRIGSMPYVNGNPALVVLHLGDNRGYEYYLWNGSSFEARPDHSIYAQNMDDVRSFTHNVINDTTMHLVFGLGTTMHHLWKNYDHGSGAWNHQTIESSPNTVDVEWYPITTVRGDNLYLFYCKKSSSSIASSLIYYMRWSQASQTWSDPALVSTVGGSSSRDPNTCFQVPVGANYVPVFWRSGGSPYSIYFAKVMIDGVATDTIPPGRIIDLGGGSVSELGEIDLNWTAPGDDAHSGTADHYEIRHAALVLDESNWSTGVLASPAPTPLAAGETQAVTLSSLPSDQIRYFAMKAFDEVGNLSEISNVFEGVLSESYSVTVNITGLGSVILDPLGGTYAEGTSVTLSAIPTPGWSFNSWSGDHTATDNPTSLTITGSVTVTATFAEDVTPPTLACPLAATVECGSSTDPEATGQPDVTDDYDPAPVLTLEDGPETAGVFVRTWTATDASGNAATCEQTISIKDTSPPIMTCPRAIAVDCAGAIDPTATGQPVVSDVCDAAPTVGFLDGPITHGIFVRTWTATDATGNAADCEQFITIVDATPPVVTCPADVNAGCGESIDPAATGFATAVDDCDGGPAVTYTDAVEGTTVTRSWVAIDASGNVSESCSQSISIKDTELPVVVCPPGITVDCAVLLEPANTGMAASTDNCDTDPAESYADSQDGHVVTRTWVATDAAGNESEPCSQLITIEDTEVPVITCPDDIAIHSEDPVTPDFTGRPTVTDNCDDAIVSSMSDTQIDNVITRTWTATDAHGNPSECVQLITIENRAPVIACQENMAVDIGEEIVLSVTATDDDGDPVTILVRNLMTGAVFDGAAVTVIPTCDDPGEYTMLFIASDGLLADTCSWVLTVNEDPEPPVATCPEDITQDNDPGECGAVAVFAMSATDNCLVADVTAAPLSGTLFEVGTTDVTVAATDATGNVGVCTFSVTVNDVEAPVLACPADTDVECGTATDPETTECAAATDACDESPSVIFSDILSGYTIERTWATSDADGNIAEPCVQTIRFVNCSDVKPVFGLISDGVDGLHGVGVYLLDSEESLLATTYTDETGNYMFEEVEAGSYFVEAGTPLGFAPATDPVVAMTVLDAPVEVNFVVEVTAGSNSASAYWWMIELDILRGNRSGTPVLSIEDIDGHLIDVYSHFYDREDGFAIAIEDLTYTDDPPRAMIFDELVSEVYFEEVYDASDAARSRRYMMTCLLNIASGLLSQLHLVSDDGATASQAITYLVGLHLSGDVGNISSAATHFKSIWRNVMIPAGVIPLSTPNIIYKPEDDGELLPIKFVLQQNYPNPFNPATTIEYSIPERSHVTIDICNVLGQRVRSLVDREEAAGSYKIAWNGADDSGGLVATGVYLYRFQAGDRVQTKKMLLLK